MTRRAKVLWAVGGVVVSLLAVVLVIAALGYRQFMRDVITNTERAAPFTPDCTQVTSSVCDTWMESGRAHSLPTCPST
jgi:hypothetical protein